MAIVMNGYLKLLPEPKELGALDGASAAFPEFYDYCVEARYVYMLGFYDVVGMIYRVALESLLHAYITTYCGRRISQDGRKVDGEMLDNKHRLDRNKLCNLINTWLEDVKSDVRIKYMANPIKTLGNDCIHGQFKPSKEKVDELWVSLVEIYSYMVGDILVRRCQERIEDLASVSKLILDTLFETFSFAFINILDQGTDIGV